MFQIGDALSRGWEDLKNNLVPLLAAIIVAGLTVGAIYLVFVLLMQVASGSEVMLFVVTLLMSAALLVVTPVLHMGLIAVFLKVARGEEATVGDVFSQTDKLVPGIVAGLIVGLAVQVGALLLIVPGIIISLMTCLTLYFVVDQNMGAIDAIKASIDATNGHKMSLFAFVLVGAGIYLLGSLACGVGALVAAPLVGCAFTHVYLALSQQASVEGYGETLG